MEKKQVYFNEYNVLMENAIYFPLVSGLLQAYAQTKDVIRENYQFMPFVFIRDHPDKILQQYKNPAVASFSVSMWNMNLSLNVAQQIKQKFPECLIILGGPHTPFNAIDFFEKYPFIDVTVRGEGEQTFAYLLIKYLNTRDFKDIPGISYRDVNTGKCIKNTEERQLVKDLDMYPSPFLEGLYDYLLKTDINFQVIMETNRGCPFSCCYCFWGQGGLNKRYRLFSLDRVKKIAEWCGKNKIKYVFCADSNFGIFKRDLEIAGYFVDIKKKYNYPEKFRVCYSKNAEKNVYEIGKMLHKYSMEKGITISRQTNCLDALVNVGRENIKISMYNNLQKKYNQENIPVYTELILNLPGETCKSFIEGIEEILESGIKNQLFVYFCQVYPNTKLADKEYQKKFRINTISVPLNEIHAAVRQRDITTEYEDIIISTYSMTVENWKHCAIVSWVMQLFYALKLCFFILIYMADKYHVKYTDFFEYISLLKMESEKIKILKKEIAGYCKLLDSILQGNSRGIVAHDFGSIYWEPEEASYLNIVNNKEDFFSEMFEVVKEFLDDSKIDYDVDEIEEIIKYQKARVPDYASLKPQKYHFKYNIPEYFDKFFLQNKQDLAKISQDMVIADNRDYKGDKKLFAQEIVVWGRKSDKMLYAVKWSNSNEMKLL